MVVNEYVEYYDLLNKDMAALDRIRYEYLMEVEQLNQEFVVNKNIMLEQAILEHTLTPINEATISAKSVMSFIMKLIQSFIRFVKKLIFSAISRFKGEKGKVLRSKLDLDKSDNEFQRVYISNIVIKVANNLVSQVFKKSNLDFRGRVQKDRYTQVLTRYKDNEYYNSPCSSLSNTFSILSKDYAYIYGGLDVYGMLLRMDDISNLKNDEGRIRSRIEDTKASLDKAIKDIKKENEKRQSKDSMDERISDVDFLIRTLLVASNLFTSYDDDTHKASEDIRSKLDMNNIDFGQMCNMVIATLKNRMGEVIKASHENVALKIPDKDDESSDSTWKWIIYTSDNSVLIDDYEEKCALLKTINVNQSALFTGSFCEKVKEDAIDDITSVLNDMEKAMATTMPKIDEITNVIKTYGGDVGLEFIKGYNSVISEVKNGLEQQLKSIADALTCFTKVFSTYDSIMTNIINAFMYVNAKEVDIQK